MRTPVDKLLVRIDKKFNDELKTSGGLILYKDTSYNPQDHVTIEGEVISVPDKLSQDPFKKDIVPEVEVGDKVFFSYMVVFDRIDYDNPEAFFEVSEGVWQNQEGDSIEIGQVPEALTREMGRKTMWVGIYKNRYDEIVDSCSGSRGDVDRWATQFKFTLRDEMGYANCLVDNIWMVDYQWVMAVKRSDKYIMIGGYVMVDPTIVDFTLSFSDGTPLVVPEYMKKAQKKGEARVVSVGTPKRGKKPIGIEEGDTVIYDPRFAEKYIIEGKDVEMIKQHQIYAKVENANGETLNS